MNMWNTKAGGLIASVPGALYGALPSVLMGILLNTLDAVSTGLLLFPSARGFEGLQVQAMSMFLMSTFTSQLVLCLGASRFSGAIGSMLVEVLPFLRAIASTIRDALGDNNPALIPTVMAAYAMTSLLIGIVFLILGALKCGRLVGYFPKTVLSGIVGAIGISLFTLGLSLSVPPASGHLSPPATPCIPLLFASCLSALFLSFSPRSNFLRTVTKGATQHALYVPIFVLAITGIFWFITAIAGSATAEGIVKLAKQGWLFTVESEVRKRVHVDNAWNYWHLFDFTKVEWRAMRGAVVDIFSLVVIGVLNLPIFASALALSLNIPCYSMDRELLGHAASNVLAGVAGTVPNMIVFSNSLFFVRAGGGRLGAVLVASLTLGLFFVSPYLLPYIPTLLAATFVLFIGLELMIEALWESAKTLQFCEWSIVMSTVVACTLLGFASGVGIGFGVALIIHFWWSVVDSRAQSTAVSGPRDQITCQESSPHKDWHPTHDGDECGPSPNIDIEKNAAEYKYLEVTPPLPNTRIIRLTGYVFFATIPSIERELNLSRSSFILFDLTQVHRIETSVAIFIRDKARELATKPQAVTVVLCGVVRESGVHHDLQRGHVACVWAGEDDDPDGEKVIMMCFEGLREAIRWCDENMHQGQGQGSMWTVELTDRPIRGGVSENKRMEILDDFACLLNGLDEIPPRLPGGRGPKDVEFVVGGMDPNILKVRRYDTEHTLFARGQIVDRVIFVIHGRLHCKSLDPNPAPAISRSSLVDTLMDFIGRLRLGSDTFRGGGVTTPTLPARTLHVYGRGDVLGLSHFLTSRRSEWDSCDLVVPSPEPCYTVEVDRAAVSERTDREKIIAWAAKATAILNERAALEFLYLPSI